MVVKLPYADYAATEGVNFSTLKEMAKSPLHYRYAVDNERPDKPHFVKGRAAHTAVLDPDNFIRHYVLCELKDRRAKGFKEFAKAHAGKTILFEKEYQTALAIRDGVRRNKAAMKLLEGAAIEKAFTWTDPETKVKCKVRIDAVSGSAVKELKTSRTINARRFGSLSAAYAYHAQLSWQRDAAITNGLAVKDAYVIAVESVPPFACTVFRFGDEELGAGYSLYSSWLKTLVQCRETNTWPGPGDDVQDIRLPAYVFDDDDDFDGELTATEVATEEV